MSCDKYAKYRIREIGDRRFIVQHRGLLWGWNSMFLGSWSDLPTTFSTFEEAEAELFKFWKESSFQPRTVKCY